MITQTVAATNAWKASDRTLDAIVTVVSTDYHTTDLASITYDGGAFTGDTLGIGSNYENNITVTFAHLVEGFVQGQLVTAKIGIKLPDGTFEYSSLGVFVISDDIGMDRNGDATTIKCYDLMCLLEGTYTSKLTYPAKVTDVIAEIANLAGVPLNTSDIARLPAQPNLLKAISGQTYRDAIGWLAQLYAGFALFDRDGKLTIRTITDTDYAIDASQYEQGGLTKNEAAYTIGGIQCQVTTTTTDSDGNSTDSTVTLQSGSSTGSQIQLTNNIMTQARLDAIWALIKNVNFYPFSLNWFGNPAIEAGDWFALLDTKGNRFNVPNSSYQMTFDGSFSSVSSAQQTATSSSTYSYGGDITKAIINLQKVTAGLNAYTHIAYADSTTGSGFSQDPTGKSYIGFYSDSNSIDSTDPTLYNWSLIQGAASYVHIAYADSSAGTGLSQDPTNKKYIGTYSDSTAVDSSDPTKYTWMLFVGQDGATGAQGIPGTTGATGVGVSGTTITYQVSTSGTTVPTGTWLTTVPTLPAGQYLWTRTVLSYTNSTTATSYSVSYAGTNGSNGVAGATGADGKTPYFHTAYSTASDGSTGFSTTDPTDKTYLGTYSDFTQADSTIASSYVWQLIKGADGEDGAKGATGATGATGKGITSTVVTYQASSSGTSAPTGTWNSTIPSVSASQYLWTRTVITFSDGATTTAYSVGMMGATGATGAQGIPGTTGANGQTPYFHIAYADSSDGKTNFSVDTAGTRQYIGTYSDFTSADSTDPTKYTWQLTKGATGTTGATGAPGTNGTNGTDGKTSYFHIAYADSADGKTNFSTSVAGTRLYIGTYSDFTLAGSTDPSMYVWQLTKGNTGAAGQDITAISYGTTAPSNPKENDLWYKQNGNSIELWIYHNGAWVLDIDNALGTRITNEATAKMQDAEDYTDDTAKNLISELSSVNKIVNSEFNTATAQKTVVGTSQTVYTPNSKGYADQNINENYFSINNWKNTTKTATNTGSTLKIQLKANTVYTASTNTPYEATNSYTDVFFYLPTVLGTAGSVANGVALVKNVTLTTGSDGIAYVSIRNYDPTTWSYWLMINEGNSAFPWTKAIEDGGQAITVHDPVDGTYEISGKTSTKSALVQVKNSSGTVVGSQDLSAPTNPDQTITSGSFSAVTHDNDDGTGTASIATPTAGTSLAVTDELNKLIFSNANMGIPNKALDSEFLKTIATADQQTTWQTNVAGDTSIVKSTYNGHNVLDIKKTSGSSVTAPTSALINVSSGQVWSSGFWYRVLTDVTFANNSSAYIETRTAVGGSGSGSGTKVNLSAGTAWRYVSLGFTIPSGGTVARIRIDVNGTGHIQIAIPTLTQTANPIDYVADTVDVTKWLATLPADGKAYKATINDSTILNFNMPTAIDRYSYDFTFPAIQGNYNLVLPEGTYPFTVKQQVFPLTINGYTVSANGTVSGTAPTNTATVYVIGSNGSSYSTAVKADKTFAIAVNTDGSTYTVHNEYAQSYTGLTDWHDSDPNLPAAAYTLASELVATSKVIEISNTTIYADDIPVFANVIVSLGAQFKLISGSATLQMAFFKNDGTGLGVQTTAISGSVWTAISLLKQTTPANTDYIRVSIIAPSGTVRISQPLFVLASALPPYTAGIGISGKGVLGLFNNNYALGLFNNSGAIIAGINGNTDGMRLTGKTISLDGDVVATGDFWANQINAIKINAANIIAGTIDANKINVINLDASSIVAGVITGTNLSINLNDGSILFQKGSIKSTNGLLNIDIDNGTFSQSDANGNGVLFTNGNIWLSDVNSTSWPQKYGSISWFESLVGGTGSSGGAGIGISGTRSALISVASLDGKTTDKSLIMDGDGIELFSIDSSDTTKSALFALGSNGSSINSGKGHDIYMRTPSGALWTNSATMGTTFGFGATDIYLDWSLGIGMGQPSTIYHITSNMSGGSMNFYAQDHFYFSKSIQQNSLLSRKQVLGDYDHDVLDEINKTDIKRILYKDNLEGSASLTPIIDDVNAEKQYYIPDMINGYNSVDLYSMISMSWLGIQAEDTKVEALKDRISKLETQISELKSA
ncbi:gp58-like family protein [Oenococcus sicerae]|uniref:beta strand repeat-containing protein n=1 Tax=Oenococcus sicerae TaxID=2203724 RepID=UPI0039EBF1A5